MAKDKPEPKPKLTPGKKASQAAVWIILALLILGLGGFGVTNFGGSVQSVARVGDTEITVQRYGRELQRELRALAQQRGQAVSFSEAQAFGLDRVVLGRLIAQAALDDEADRLGISVGDETVGAQITDISAFQGLDGSFDRDAYAFALENAGLSVAEFEEQVRADTARNILEAAVVGGVEAPEAYTDTLHDWARETRDITWALLGPDDLAEPLPEPTEAELAAFHEANAERFTLPETKAITYAWLTPEMMLGAVEPSEEELREAYEAQADAFRRPERRLVERLVFGTEDEARAALARIESGDASFAGIVEDRGLELSDIDLGEVAVDDLGEAGEDVFALEEPGIAGPLPSPLGPALFRVNAILSATETSFDEARDELAAELASDRARREIEALYDEFEDMLAGGATLEELAEETEMELGTIDFRQGVDDGIAAYQEFRDAALLAEEGDFPEIYAFEEGGLFALRVDEVRPPALQPLAEVRPAVRDAWEAAEAERRLTERAQEAAQAIEGGAEMAGLDLPLRTARGLSRDGFLEDAPAQMVENVFQMQEGDVRVFAAEGGAALVRLDTVIPPDGDDAEAQAIKSDFSARAAQAIAGDALQMFTRAVEAEAGIEIDQQAINAVHAQFN